MKLYKILKPGCKLAGCCEIINVIKICNGVVKILSCKMDCYIRTYVYNHQLAYRTVFKFCKILCSNNNFNFVGSPRVTTFGKDTRTSFYLTSKYYIDCPMMIVHDRNMELYLN